MLKMKTEPKCHLSELPSMNPYNNNLYRLPSYCPFTLLIFSQCQSLSDTDLFIRVLISVPCKSKTCV